MYLILPLCMGQIYYNAILHDHIPRNTKPMSIMVFIESWYLDVRKRLNVELRTQKMIYLTHILYLISP